MPYKPQTLSLEDWHNDLRAFADATPHPWVISPCATDHLEGYLEGLTPQEELEAQIEDASR